jgi:hypothetical protein
MPPEGCWKCLGLTHHDMIHTLCDLAKAENYVGGIHCYTCNRMIPRATRRFCRYCHDVARKPEPPRPPPKKRKTPPSGISSAAATIPTDANEFQADSEIWLYRMANIFGWDCLASAGGGPHVRRRITKLFRVNELFDKLPDFRGDYYCNPFVLPGRMRTNGNEGGWYSASKKAARVWNEVGCEELVRMVNAKYDRLDGLQIERRSVRRHCKRAKGMGRDGGGGVRRDPAPTALRRVSVDGQDFDICNLPEIYSGLFLGNAEVASNPQLIRKLKIGAILNVTDSDQYFNHCNKTQAAAAAAAAAAAGLEGGGAAAGEKKDSIVAHYEKIAIEDTFDTKLFESHLGSAMAFLDRCLLTGTRVLVHCRAGKSRSVTVVMAWAIGRFGMKLSSLLPLLATRRKGLNVNLGFAEKIMKLEKIMLGEASVARGGQHRRSNMGKLAMLFNSGVGAK